VGAERETSRRNGPQLKTAASGVRSNASHCWHTRMYWCSGGTCDSQWPMLAISSLLHQYIHSCIWWCSEQRV